MKSESQDHLQFEEEENSENYAKERLNSAKKAKNLAFICLVFAVVQIVLDILHLCIHSHDFSKAVFLSGLKFLIGAVLAIYWSMRAIKAYQPHQQDLFKPRMDDRLTRSIFILGLLLALLAVMILINLLMQREFSVDYVVAQTTSPDIWDAKYGGRTPQGLSTFLRVVLYTELAFMVFYFLFFLFMSQTAFKCLKSDNQAMSYLVFLSNTLFFAFGLGMVYYASYAMGYEDYPQVRAHFPAWNIRSLFIAGLCVSLVSLLGFFINHRSWRVGFFLLAFLVLLLIVFLGNFIGFAYHHTSETYAYYKGIPKISTCQNRMYFVHWKELQQVGCPNKYINENQCPAAEAVKRWEKVEDNNQDVYLSPKQSETVEPQKTSTESRTASPQPAENLRRSETAPIPSNKQVSTKSPMNEEPPVAQSQPLEEAKPSEEPKETQNTTTPTTTANEPSTESQTQDEQTSGTSPTTIEEETVPKDQIEQTPTNNIGENTTPTAPTSFDNNNPTIGYINLPPKQSSGSTVTANGIFLNELGLENDFVRNLQQDYGSGYYCLNTNCCGLLGQLYSKNLLILANLGFLAMLTGGLILLACFYFWIVRWVDSNRNKKKDLLWLLIMVGIFVVFCIAMSSWKKSYIVEKLGADGRHLEISV